MPKILGREPAAVLAFVAVLIKLFSAFVLAVSPDVQASINAVLAAGVGVWVAVVVHDGAAVAIYGFAQSGVALAVGLGLHWDTERQALVLTAVQVGLAMWTRGQVTAPVQAGPAGDAQLRALAKRPAV